MENILVGVAAVLSIFVMSVATIEPAMAAPAQQLTQAQVSDRVALESLLATYLYNLDHGHTEELAALFTDDGVLDVGGGPYVGREAIATYYAARSTTRRTRHVSTNFFLVFDDADHAHATHTLTYYMGEGPGPHPATPNGVADYQEQFAKGTDGIWRFAYRKPTPVFGAGPAPTASPPAAH